MIRRVFICTWILCAALIAARVGLSAQATSAPAFQVSNPESRTPNPESRIPSGSRIPGPRSRPKGDDRPGTCVTCHSARLKSGDLVLENADVAHVANNVEMWEKVVRKLRAGVMPPQGARRPDDATMHALIASLETSLDQAAEARAESRPSAAPSAQSRGVQERDPGSAGARRRRGDTAAAGRFGVRLRQHLRRARRVAVAAGAISHSGRHRSARSPLAIARCGPAATPIAFRRICRRTSTSKGLPLGTVGGLQVRHTFPLDAEYEFRTQAVSHEPEHRSRAAVSERVRDRDRRPAGAPRHHRRQRRSGGDVRQADGHGRRRGAAHARARAREGRAARGDRRRSSRTWP